jgi:ribosomal protein S12
MLQCWANTADLQPGHSGLPQCYVVQQFWAGSAVRQAATVRLQPGVSVVGHMPGTATGLVVQQHHAVPLTEYRVAGDKTRHAHAVEDIICYS